MEDDSGYKLGDFNKQDKGAGESFIMAGTDQACGSGSKVIMHYSGQPIPMVNNVYLIPQAQ